MNWLPLILSLVGGAAGGNAVGAFLKEKGLGGLGNTIVGAIGGGGGGALLQALGMGGADAAAGGSGGIMPMIMGLISGGAGGGVLTAIVGVIKSAMAKHA